MRNFQYKSHNSDNPNAYYKEEWVQRCMQNHKSIIDLFLLLLLTLVRAISKAKCQAIADVGFILDNFDDKHGKELLKILAANFKIGFENARLGVVTVGDSYKPSIKLSCSFDISRFNADLKDKIHYASKPRGKILHLVQQELFAVANGGRNAVPKLLILITKSSKPVFSHEKDLIDAVNEIRSKDVNILAVGIGEDINKTMLQMITGSKQNMYSAINFAESFSKKFVTSVNEAICEAGKI